MFYVYIQLTNVMERQKELQQANVSTNILTTNKSAYSVDGCENVEGKIQKNTLPSLDAISHSYVEIFNIYT